MSAAQFTPGPWHASPTHNGKAFDIGAADGSNIALVRDADETPANARLIAAAPELLEALKRATDCAQALLDFAERQCEFEGCSTAIEADIHAARAAIAKAEGRS